MGFSDILLGTSSKSAEQYKKIKDHEELQQRQKAIDEWNNASSYTDVLTLAWEFVNDRRFSTPYQEKPRHLELSEITSLERLFHIGLFVTDFQFNKHTLTRNYENHNWVERIHRPFFSFWLPAWNEWQHADGSWENSVQEFCKNLLENESLAVIVRRNKKRELSKDQRKERSKKECKEHLVTMECIADSQKTLKVTEWRWVTVLYRALPQTCHGFESDILDICAALHISVASRAWDVHEDIPGMIEHAAKNSGMVWRHFGQS